MQAYTVTVTQKVTILAETEDDALSQLPDALEDARLIRTIDETDITPEMLLDDMLATRPESEPNAWQVEWGMDWERTYYGEGRTSLREILERAARQLARELNDSHNVKG